VRTAVTGSTVYVYGCRSPRSGKAAVYIDGTLRAVVDLYRSYSGCGVVYTSPGLSSATHTVTVVVLGTKNAASSGTAVAVDAVRVL
jgi:hypothetical protein